MEGDAAESYGISLSGDGCVIWNPGDTYLLAVADEDAIDQQDEGSIRFYIAGDGQAYRRVSTQNPDRTYSYSDHEYVTADKTFITSTVSGATADANNYKTTGYYSVVITTMRNMPTTNHGLLFVDFKVGTPYQIFLPDNDGRIFKRTYDTTRNEWNDWSNLLNFYQVPSGCEVIIKDDGGSINLNADEVYATGDVYVGEDLRVDTVYANNDSVITFEDEVEFRSGATFGSGDIIAEDGDIYSSGGDVKCRVDDTYHYLSQKADYDDVPTEASDIGAVASYQIPLSANTLAALKTWTNSSPAAVGSQQINDGPAGNMWYNIQWTPHRNGMGGGDNSAYGTLVMHPMNPSDTSLFSGEYIYHKTSNTWYGPYEHNTTILKCRNQDGSYDSADDCIGDGMCYFKVDSEGSPYDDDGVILWMPWGSGREYGHQLYMDDESTAFYHRAMASEDWRPWARIYDDNYHPASAAITGSKAFVGRRGYSVTATESVLKTWAQNDWGYYYVLNGNHFRMMLYGRTYANDRAWGRSIEYTLPYTLRQGIVYKNVEPNSFEGKISPSYDSHEINEIKNTNRIYVAPFRSRDSGYSSSWTSNNDGFTSADSNKFILFIEGITV